MVQHELEINCKRCDGTGVVRVRAKRGLFDQLAVCACFAGRSVAVPTREVYRHG